MTTAPTQTPSVKLESGWLAEIGVEFDKPYMQDLRRFLLAEKQQGKVIYPKTSDIFNALNRTPFDAVKVVILGQDPYHGDGQAHGLSFSVPCGTPVPPSLKNIYKEIYSDPGLGDPAQSQLSDSLQDGNLNHWAAQGVLLLNSVLTVERASPASHQGKGWEVFTDSIIRALNERRQHLVFMLWGNYAQKKARFVDTTRHLSLKAPHPSPLSAHRGFLGCQHFSRANSYLKKTGQTAIDWLAKPDPQAPDL